MGGGDGDGERGDGGGDGVDVGGGGPLVTDRHAGYRLENIVTFSCVVTAGTEGTWGVAFF